MSQRIQTISLIYTSVNNNLKNRIECDGGWSNI